MGIPEIPAQDFSQVRPGRDQAAVAHQAPVRPASAPRLAQHPARHPWRRGRHHRARRLPQGAGRRRQGQEGLPRDAARLPDEGDASRRCTPSRSSTPRSAPEKDALIYKRYYHIGIAVDTPDGLVVPVLKDVDRKGIVELSQELGASRRRRATASSRPPTCRARASPSPRSAASAAPTSRRSSTRPRWRSSASCARRWQPVWDGEEFMPRLMQPLYVSYDHRVIDGALAARFTRHLCHVLEDVRRLVL